MGRRRTTIIALPRTKVGVTSLLQTSRTVKWYHRPELWTRYLGAAKISDLKLQSSRRVIHVGGGGGGGGGYYDNRTENKTSTDMSDSY